LRDHVKNDTAVLSAVNGVCGGRQNLSNSRTTYLTSASGISTGRHKPSGLSGFHLKGADLEASILKIVGMETDNSLPYEKDKWSVENLTFGMRDYQMITQTVPERFTWSLSVTYFEGRRVNRKAVFSSQYPRSPRNRAHYNDYLARLIRESTQSKDLIDLGACIGTFTEPVADGRFPP
jgi:hypothetical protein